MPSLSLRMIGVVASFPIASVTYLSEAKKVHRGFLWVAMHKSVLLLSIEGNPFTVPEGDKDGRHGSRSAPMDSDQRNIPPAARIPACGRNAGDWGREFCSLEPQMRSAIWGDHL